MSLKTETVAAALLRDTNSPADYDCSPMNTDVLSNSGSFLDHTLTMESFSNATDVTTTTTSVTTSAIGNTSVRRSNRGKGKALAQAGLDEKINKYCTSDGVEYVKEDTVYLEDVARPDKTFSIGMVEYFRLSRRLDCMQVHVKLFYRKNEVPDSLYGALCERESVESRDIRFADPSAKHRELLISEALAVMPACALRGKCRVEHFAQMRDAAANFHKQDDNFFFVFSYNPETRRLASMRAEIRVGPRYQVDPPPVHSREAHQSLRLNAAAAATTTSTAEVEKISDVSEWEEMRWAGPHAILDDELVQYLRAARSITAFHGLCDLGSPAEGKSTAEMDDTTQYAYDMLHDMDYQRALALMVLAKNPYPHGKSPRLWTHEDVRAFARAMRVHNKNFYRMHCEVLPHKSVKEIILFYYLWKKTSSCSVQKKSQTRSCTARRKERSPTPTGSNSTVGNSDVEDSVAMVDEENEDEEEEEEDKACRNCLAELGCKSTSSSVLVDDVTTTTAKRDSLCQECRLFYQKYGQERPIARLAAALPSKVSNPLGSAIGEEDESVEEENESGSGSSSAASSDDSDEAGSTDEEDAESESVALVPKQLPNGDAAALADLVKVKVEPPSPPAALDSSSVALLVTKKEFESIDEDDHYTPAVSPPPQACSLEAYRSKSVSLCRVWSRSQGSNSCARVDLVPKFSIEHRCQLVSQSARIQRQHSAPAFHHVKSGASPGSSSRLLLGPAAASRTPDPLLSQVKREPRRSTPPTPSAMSMSEAARVFETHSAQQLLSSFARPHLLANNVAASAAASNAPFACSPFAPPLPPPGADPDAYYRHLFQMGLPPPGTDPRFDLERKYHEMMLGQQHIHEMMLRSGVNLPPPPPPHLGLPAPPPSHMGTVRPSLLPHTAFGPDLPTQSRGHTPSSSVIGGGPVPLPPPPGADPFDPYNIRQLAAHAQHLAMAQHHHHNHTHLHLHQPVPPPQLPPAQQEAFDYYRLQAEMAAAAATAAASAAVASDPRGADFYARGAPPAVPPSPTPNAEQFAASLMSRFGGGMSGLPPAHHSMAGLEAAMLMEQQMRVSMGLPPH